MRQNAPASYEDQQLLLQLQASTFQGPLEGGWWREVRAVLMLPGGAGLLSLPSVGVGTACDCATWAECLGETGWTPGAGGPGSPAEPIHTIFT